MLILFSFFFSIFPIIIFQSKAYISDKLNQNLLFESNKSFLSFFNFQLLITSVCQKKFCFWPPLVSWYVLFILLKLRLIFLSFLSFFFLIKIFSISIIKQITCRTSMNFYFKRTTVHVYTIHLFFFFLILLKIASLVFLLKNFTMIGKEVVV